MQSSRYPVISYFTRNKERKEIGERKDFQLSPTTLKRAFSTTHLVNCPPSARIIARRYPQPSRMESASMLFSRTRWVFVIERKRENSGRSSEEAWVSDEGD